MALPLGILMGAFEPINRLFEPIVAPLRYMPISAFIPLLILWFGIYEKQKIAFLFLGVFVYLLPVVVTAIRAVPEELVQTALTLGASQWQVDPHRAAAGGAARDLRLLPGDERHLLDLRHPRRGREPASTASATWSSSRARIRRPRGRSPASSSSAASASSPTSSSAWSPDCSSAGGRTA